MDSAFIHSSSRPLYLYPCPMASLTHYHFCTHTHMEYLSELKHSLPKSTPILLGFFLLSSMEAFFILHKQEPIFQFLSLSSGFLVVLICFLKSYFSAPPHVYLVDFSCLKPPTSCRVPFTTFIEHSRINFSLDQETVEFISKVLTSSGQGQHTYLPPALHYIPPRSTHEEATKEAQMVLFPVFEDLLSKTNLTPTDIDILIVNCSGFCPSPSLSSIVINNFSMREDIKSFSISGMGCSASALAIDMAQNLLKVHRNSNALILSTEILSNSLYAGKEPTKMIINCLFRMGSAAILLTNKTKAKSTSKYKLLWSLRTQGAFEDEAYLSTMREEDSNGNIGVTMKRDSVQFFRETLESNITIVGYYLFPVPEKIRYGFSVIRKKFFDKSSKIYVLNFKNVVQHFCLPASGKPFIRKVGEGLNLGEKEMEPALMTMHRFGNQSSSSLWYELAYMEAKERVKLGDKVWQIGGGTGPKCISLVWKCVRPIVGEARNGPWADSIDTYPRPHLN